MISPEGCAAILWKDQDRKSEAAEALRLTAPEVESLGVLDGVIPEPLGGAHTNVTKACRMVGEHLERALEEVSALSSDELIADRYAKFRALGAIEER